MRIILYTGKGGVGKTCVAAATAIRLANEGHRVLLMSTDQAHSLSDSLAMKLGSEPTAVIPNLDALEIDVVKESEKAWGSLKSYIKQMILSRAEGGIEAEELLIFPGLEELFSLFTVLDYYEKKKYDVIIVDCAPTGETLNLLKYPEMLGEIVSKILPMKRQAVKIAGPVVEKVLKVPMPKDNVFEDLTKLMAKLERLQALMLNKEVLTVRLVTTPEKIVIKETKRSFTWLSLFDYQVDGIIVNKVFPQEALSGYFNRWVELQNEGLNEIRESFADLPVFYLNLLKHELKSVPVLAQIGDLYGKMNPEAVLCRTRLMETFRDNDQDVLIFHLPFADKSEMALSQAGGEIQITIKNEKRCMMLPPHLLNKQITSAKLDEGKLQIRFNHHHA
ncbi:MULTISPECIES: ArsA family ATPase [Dehalobacter]|jgi:arsenite-transporting ATPase|uniref:arsenite-transporting ATPase n=2 Tax=Dehalobacter restrictus TaxID=55583 RepID=A0A857DI12_9FIRM|nr:MULTISPECIES: ArsA family ATPase [Dehalobacter]AHF09325.1 arsenic ABC transporter ATPase [Dehalobacter restrictus DSM 9455]MCG1025214.1 ArsA family ATPase [Dehalobacter sp.]MDJ0305804.1 ArsA family ATPase [Dehalobacter sp.]OCZ52256.1 arsenic-transporting ATPase [Dehalobacter sp. TeCB1]QGZ99865.1 TRC40/GET3/ArsA family transport-energizing ATPase [Dehalobacter restrictus]